MRTYDCKVNLGGEQANQVEMKGITAAEIMLLRSIHGSGGVEPIEAVVDRKMVKTDAQELRDRLIETYGFPAFASVFGSAYTVTFPDTIPGRGKAESKGKASGTADADLEEMVA